MSAGARWAFFERFDICDADGVLYLRRWRLLSTPWFGVFLHKIVAPDADRDLHDHPWPFVSIVLRGSYRELVPSGKRDGLDLREYPRVREVRWINAKRAHYAHQIIRLWRVPTWTLVFHGPRVREWGFYTCDGWKPWQQYIAERDARRRAA